MLAPPPGFQGVDRLTTGFCGLTLSGMAFLPGAVSSSDQRSSTSQPIVALGRAARIAVARAKHEECHPLRPA